MIARIRAWVGARKQLNEEINFQLSKAAERDEVIARLEKLIADEKLISERLTGEVNRLVKQNNVINLRVDAAIAEATRLRADHAYVTAARCECGGDAELHWQQRAAAAERQAHQDRANAVRLADEVERLQLIADEAERLHRAIELGRAGIAVVA